MGADNEGRLNEPARYRLLLLQRNMQASSCGWQGAGVMLQWMGPHLCGGDAGGGGGGGGLVGRSRRSLMD